MINPNEKKLGDASASQSQQAQQYRQEEDFLFG